MRFALLVALMQAAIVQADQAGLVTVVQVEAKVANGVCILTAKTEAKNVLWIDKDEGLVEAVPAELLKDSKTRVVAGKAGKYRVVAVVAGEKPIWGEATFTLGGPNPGPTPPPNPPPVPPIPPPVDDFAAKLAAAYAADMSPWKRSAVKELGAIYKVMAKHAREDKEIVTSRQLLDVLNLVKKDRIPDANVLRAMRLLIADRVAAVVGPPTDAPFDRARVSAVFEQVVAALPAVD